jgi:transcriptional regulator with XRE-family HTH domain
MVDLPTMTVPRKTALGKRLTMLRKRLDLTQAQIAEKVGASTRSWSSWERGEEKPSKPFMILIDLLDQGKL